MRSIRVGVAMIADAQMLVSADTHRASMLCFPHSHKYQHRKTLVPAVAQHTLVCVYLCPFICIYVLFHYMQCSI